MQELNFPTYTFRTRSESGVTKIFDPVRKNWIVLTPEEWVRQNLIAYLQHEYSVPYGLMAVEKEFRVNSLKKRADLVIYNKQGHPQMLAECKAPGIKLTNSTFEQAARYNLTLSVPLLLITNGLQHFCARINFENQSFVMLDNIPEM